jgi:hypothetical protein
MSSVFSWAVVRKVYGLLGEAKNLFSLNFSGKLGFFKPKNSFVL